MYHIVYLTTNLVNNKIYVGVHSTYNLNDGYLGSGKALKSAIKKYGKENFKRQILHYCESEQHIREIEAQIVDEWFISRPDTYNMITGGSGNILTGKTYDEVYGKEKSNEIKNIRKIRMYKNFKEGKCLSQGKDNPNYGGTITKRLDIRQKISKTRIHKAISKGSNNNCSREKMSSDKLSLKNTKSAMTTHYKHWLLTDPSGNEFRYFCSSYKNYFSLHPIQQEHNIHFKSLYDNLSFVVSDVTKTANSSKLKDKTVYYNTIGWKLEIES